MQPKIGSKFRLGKWTWEVWRQEGCGFSARSFNNGYVVADAWFGKEYADQLDWIGGAKTQTEFDTAIKKQILKCDACANDD